MFEPNKNAKELGIDTSRAFRMVKDSSFKKGDIIYLIYDDNSDFPKFNKIKGADICAAGSHYEYWCNLEYADEPAERKATEERRKENIKKEYMLKLSMANELSNRAIEGWCREPLGYGKSIMQELAEQHFEAIKNYYNKPNKKSMCETLKDNIVEFAKNLTLSADEKALRQAGLKDSEGNWTLEAQEIVVQKKAVQIGFKDWKDMIRKLNITTTNLSAIEYQAIFTEFAADLLAIAKAKVEEDKK